MEKLNNKKFVTKKPSFKIARIFLLGRQVRTLGMKTVLVGGIIDGVFDVGRRIDESEATANGEALVLLAGVHQLGGLLMSLAIGLFVSVIVSVKADVVQWCFLHNNRLIRGSA